MCLQWLDDNDPINKFFVKNHQKLHALPLAKDPPVPRPRVDAARLAPAEREDYFQHARLPCDVRTTLRRSVRPPRETLRPRAEAVQGGLPPRRAALRGRRDRAPLA